jgi:predicted Zn-dependent protease with MMP-like domain
MNSRLFQSCVVRAIEEIPEVFRSRMGNVDVVVEDFADPEALESVGLQSPWDLLGLYSGHPFGSWGFFAADQTPGTIFLYRAPIVRAAGVPEAVVEEIRRVLIHEVGHHLGFDDDELAAIEGRSE